MRLKLMIFTGFILGFISYASAFVSKIESENLLTSKKTSVALTNPAYKACVLIFMSAVCPCSDSHMSVVKKLITEYKNFHFVVIHSNGDESLEVSKAYFAKANLPVDVLEDSDAKIADEFKANKTPHAFIIDNAGEIVYRGGITNSAKAYSADKFYLADALKDISEARPVQVTGTRTLGCAIVRKGEKNVL